jgi:PTS system fructose-specific IIA component
MIIHESLVELHVKSNGKKQIIETLARKANKLGRISDVEGYIQAVFALDESFPTAFGYGVAIPYGKSSYVQTPFIAFARSDDRFQWDRRVDHEVRLIFLIGVPENQEEDLDFKMLTHVSGGLTNESYRKKLLEADDATEVVAIFEEMGL